MVKKYKTFRTYLPEVKAKLKNRNVKVEKYGSGNGFYVNGENAQQLYDIIEEYKSVIDMPEYIREVFKLKEIRGYQIDFKKSTIGIKGTGRPFSHTVYKVPSFAMGL